MSVMSLLVLHGCRMEALWVVMLSMPLPLPLQVEEEGGSRSPVGARMSDWNICMCFRLDNNEDGGDCGGGGGECVDRNSVM